MEFLHGLVSFKILRLGRGTPYQGGHHLRWMELDVFAANRLGVTDCVAEMIYGHSQGWSADRKRK